MAESKKSQNKKPKIAIVSLTSCEGCSFAILDLGERFIKSLDYFKLGDFHLLKEKKEKVYYDITFVDGAPLTSENIKTLKQIRKKSKLLIALGTCAHLGVVPQIKNYVDKNKVVRYVYNKEAKNVFNPDIKPLSFYVKVDFTIPGCPIDKEEFLRILTDLREEAQPYLPERPVCYECQLQGEECLLQKGQPCLGPVILGGCGAVCLKSGFYCRGCRGLLPGATTAEEVQKLNKKLVKMIGKKELNQMLEIFGIRKEWEKLVAPDRQ